MLNYSVETRIAKSIYFALFMVTLLVTPWMNLDAINVPKFFVLTSMAVLIMGVLVGDLKKLFNSKFRATIVLSMLFQVLLLASAFLNSMNLQQFYGVYGRNTGLLCYFSFTVLLMVSAIVGKASFGRRILFLLIVTSAFNLVYGIFQFLDLDPVDWANPYNPIVGTLGNPNFVSAFYGMGAIATLAILLGPTTGALKLVLGVLTISLLSISYISDAIQGLAVFLLGASVILYFRFIHSLNVFIRIIFFSVVVSGLVAGILGALQIGPLRTFLYQDSIMYRGDYWRAGWSMTLQNPIFGVGIDGYGDWYRFFRTQEAAFRRGPDVVSNSAHNVFLDISSGAGLPVLFLYILVLGLIARCGLRIMLREISYDPIGVGLFACWVGYIAQSAISINQIGLAIWGWVLSGSIIGYYVYGSRSDFIRSTIERKPVMAPQKVIGAAIGITVGVLVSLPPLYQDAKFRSALEKADGAAIREAALIWPKGTYYLDYASQLFLENKLDELALELTEESIDINPRNYFAWSLLLRNSTVSASEKASAESAMRELDPFGEYGIKD